MRCNNEFDQILEMGLVGIKRFLVSTDWDQDDVDNFLEYMYVKYKDSIEKNYLILFFHSDKGGSHFEMCESSEMIEEDSYFENRLIQKDMN